jgi:hypothetical protein
LSFTGFVPDKTNKKVSDSPQSFIGYFWKYPEFSELPHGNKSLFYFSGRLSLTARDITGSFIVVFQCANISPALRESKKHSHSLNLW